MIVERTLSSPFLHPHLVMIFIWNSQAAVASSSFRDVSSFCWAMAQQLWLPQFSSNSATFSYSQSEWPLGAEESVTWFKWKILILQPLNSMLQAC